MIRPEDVSDDRNNTEEAQLRQARIEEYFDRCLQRGLTNGRAEINYTRGGWLREDIAAVLQRYRDAGWNATDTGHNYVFERRS